MRRRAVIESVEAAPEVEGEALRPRARVIAPSTRSVAPGVYVFEWMDELSDVMQSGELLEALSHEPVMLGQLLYDWAIYRGDAERAAELAEVLPGFWEEELGPLVDVYLARGNREHATELALRAFAGEPDDQELLDGVLELAPTEGLRILEERYAGELDDLDRSTTLVQVRLLQRLGRMAEARATLLRLDESLAGHCSPYDDVDALLAELAPELFEERLRRSSGSRRDLLVPLLVSQGRLDEADAILEEALAEAPEDVRAWSQLGELHWARGQQDEAVEAWLQCWQLGGGGHVDELLHLAPDRALALAKGDAIVANDDELWGEYGDFCWRVDRRFEAETAWRRARELDPDDWDWMERLEKLAVGSSPVSENEEVLGVASWIQESLARR